MTRSHARIETEQEAMISRGKLQLLEESLQELQGAEGDDDVGQASIESLSQLIDQFKQEIALFEGRAPRAE